MENINKNEWEEQPEAAKPAELETAEKQLTWALYFSRGLIVAAIVLALSAFGGISFLFSGAFIYVVLLYFAALVCNIVQATLLRRYKAMLFDLKLEPTKLYKRATVGTTIAWVLIGVSPVAASPLLMFIGFMISIHPVH
jgi:hypothetical protein